MAKKPVLVKGMTRTEMLLVQDSKNDIKCSAAESKNGLWTGQLLWFRKGRLHMVVFESKPEYDTKGKALIAMNDKVAEIRAVDLYVLGDED